MVSRLRIYAGQRYSYQLSSSCHKSSVFQEWEVLLLSKLDWDMSSVIASDFIEHIVQRVRRLHPDELDSASDATVRQHSETLLTLCSAHHSFSSLNPSLVAAASVLTTVRPILEAKNREDNGGEREKGEEGEEDKSGVIEDVLDNIEMLTMIDKVRIIILGEV